MSLADRFPWAFEGHEPDWDDSAVPDDLNEVVRRSMLDGLQNFDPRAALPMFLDIRLSGPRVRSGSLDFAHSGLLKKFQLEVAAMLPPSERDLAELQVVGIGSGSVVLHARPHFLDERPGSQMDLDSVSLLERALSKILDLHDDLEQGIESDVLSKRKESVLDRLRQLVAELDEVDVNLEVNMSSSDGSRRSSRITEQGRRHAGQVFDRKRRVEPQTLTGLVHLASLDGAITLKNVEWHSKISRKRTIEVKSVPKLMLSRGEIALGNRATVSVDEITVSDSVGTQAETAYKFRDLIDRGQSTLNVAID